MEEIEYTKDQIMNAVREELIEAYGSLSNSDTPYMVLGILEKSFERLQNEDILPEVCFKCGRSCDGMPIDECITCFQKGLM